MLCKMEIEVVINGVISWQATVTLANAACHLVTSGLVHWSLFIGRSLVAIMNNNCSVIGR